MDRNPSPPPELLQQLQDFVPDRVGDSVFSKRWLIQVLINVVESVNKEAVENEIKSVSDSEFKESSTSEDIREIDPKLEDDVCALWDMSVNKDVACFLQEFKIVDILIEAIVKTKCPRLVEIAIGILGNIASFDDICQDMTNNEDVLKTIIPLVGSSDAPTVIQVLGLIRTCVVNENSSEQWLEVLRKDPTFMNNMKFILQNSLNSEVLKGALQLLYYVLDNDVDSCEIWSEESYMKSLELVATQMASRKDGNSIDELWLLLNLLCQYEECVISIGKYFDILYNVFILYINLFGEFDHTVLPHPERTAAVAAGFTTFATLSKGNEDSLKKLEDETFVKTVKKMYKTTRRMLMKDTSGNNFEENAKEITDRNGDAGNNDSFYYCGKLSEDNFNSLTILQETIVEFCKFALPSIIEDEFNREENS